MQFRGAADMGVPGCRAMGLIADGRLVWIMRELAVEGLHGGQLGERLGIPHSTLVEKIAVLDRAEVLHRETAARRSDGAVLRLAEVGVALLRLIDGTLSWWLEADPTVLPLVFGASGPLVPRILADEATPRVLAALAERPRRLANLELALPDLTRSQVKTRVEALSVARLVVRRPNGRIEARPAGREVLAFQARGARLEQRHELPGAAPPEPPHIAAFLRVTLPLLSAPPDFRCSWELTIEPDDHEGPGERLLVIADPGEPLYVLDRPRRRSGPCAAARGSVQDWCGALLDGRSAGLHLEGEAGVAALPADGLNSRLFAAGEGQDSRKFRIL